MTRVQLFGDYLLPWIAGSSEMMDYGVTKLYVITRKHGSTMYSLIVIIYHIGCGIDDAGSSGKILRGSTELSIFQISNDVLSLIQLDPLGIELCQVSDMQNEGEEGAMNGRHHNSRNDGLRMDRMCMLLFPLLRQRLRQQRDGTTTAVATAFCVGEHSSHQIMVGVSPWTTGARPDISPVGGDSVVSVVMEIMGATVTCATLKSSCAATLCSLTRMESMWSQLPLCATSMPRKGMKMMLCCGTHGGRGRPPSRHWIPRPWDGET
jgi:hypothetical protein